MGGGSSYASPSPTKNGGGTSPRKTQMKGGLSGARIKVAVRVRPLL